MSDLNEYLLRLRERLPLRRRDRIIAEVRDHLLCKMEALRAGGMSEDEAMAAALSEFGSVEQIAAAFVRETGDIMTRFWKLTCGSLATMTMLAALAVAGQTAVDREGAAWWIAVKILAALIIVISGVMTLRRIRAAGFETPLLAAALLTLTVGTAGTVWTIHLGLVTGDFEAWALGINLLLIAQSVLTIAWLWFDRTPQTV